MGGRLREGKVNEEQRIANPLLIQGGDGKSFLIFTYFLPLSYINEVVIPMTSAKLLRRGMQKLDPGYLFFFVVIWLIMATMVGFGRNDYWFVSKLGRKHNGCPYKFNKHMHHSHFRSILSCLQYTNEAKPN